MGGRRTGVLTIGSSEGIALGNGGPLRSRALAENKFVGTATTLACLLLRLLPLCRRCLLTLALGNAAFVFMSFDISALILPARVLPTRL